VTADYERGHDGACKRSPPEAGQQEVRGDPGSVPRACGEAPVLDLPHYPLNHGRRLRHRSASLDPAAIRRIT